jgi:polyisoprenoid-binding protein YceI
MRKFLFLLLLAGTAHAAQTDLLPPGTKVEFRGYGFGFIPFDGKFTRFHGLISYDPRKPEQCHVMLRIEAASLDMANPAMRDRITGPEFLDVARFPDLNFDGTCEQESLTGDLLLHGQTHPFAMDMTREDADLIAAGRLKRADWGITGSSFTAGSTIRIRVMMPNPAAERTRSATPAEPHT